MKDKLDIKDVYLFQNEDTDFNFHLWIFPRHERMEKFWRKIESVRPIMLRAEKNMMNEKVIKKIQEYVDIMKEYMQEK